MKLWTGVALIAAGTAVVFGLSALEGSLLAVVAAVASVAALTTGTLLTGLADEDV